MKRKLGMSDKAITKLVSQTDLDGDGTIDFNEFLHLVENVETKRVLHKALIQRAGIRKAFEKYDRDKKGFLTRYLSRRTLSTCQRLLSPPSRAHFSFSFKDCFLCPLWYSRSWTFTTET